MHVHVYAQEQERWPLNGPALSVAALSWFGGGRRRRRWPIASALEGCELSTCETAVPSAGSSTAALARAAPVLSARLWSSARMPPRRCMLCTGLLLQARRRETGRFACSHLKVHQASCTPSAFGVCKHISIHENIREIFPLHFFLWCPHPPLSLSLSCPLLLVHALSYITWIAAHTPRATRLQRTWLATLVFVL